MLIHILGLGVYLLFKVKLAMLVGSETMYRSSSLFLPNIHFKSNIYKGKDSVNENLTFYINPEPRI